MWLAAQREVWVDAQGCSGQVAGEVTYNGVPTDQFVMCRTASYVGQTDNHIAELTVRICKGLRTHHVQPAVAAAANVWLLWACMHLVHGRGAGGRRERCNWSSREPLGIQAGAACSSNPCSHHQGMYSSVRLTRRCGRLSTLRPGARVAATVSCATQLLSCSFPRAAAAFVRGTIPSHALSSRLLNIMKIRVDFFDINFLQNSLLPPGSN